MKKNIVPIGCLLTLILSVSACNTADENKNYKKTINQWHHERIESLTQPDSWLSLAGLYWLEPGVNTFGADSTSDIVFPPDKAPAHIGKFILNDSTITVSIASDVPVMHQQKEVSQMKLKSDANGEPTVLNLGSLSWYIIKRSGRYAVRLKDSKSALLQHFEGIDRYPVDKSWKVKATFIPYDEPKTVSIPTITGRPTETKIPGLLEFAIDGKTYQLAPFQTPGNDEFFVVFGDKTNGETTYGGGRFVYVYKPGEDNTTYIDFNLAYNPPCAFTHFATCPLPPAQNRLSIAITAGEKRFEGGQH